MDAAACFYNIKHFHENNAIYTCCVYKKDFATCKKLSDLHLTDHSDDDVRGVALSHCQFAGFPRDFPSIFPNLNHLAINGGLSEISKDDLIGYGNLTFLDISGCEITSLPGDLFHHTPNLEVIYFNRNKISSIGAKLLDPLLTLKYADFSGNLNINAVYDVEKEEELSLSELKQLISEQCETHNASVDINSKSLRVSGVNWFEY